MAQELEKTEELAAIPDVPPTNSVQKAAWISLGAIVSVASILAIVLAALGYGVALSVESKFGLPHATIYASTFELIDLSSVAITTLINAGSSILFDIDFWGKVVSSIGGWGIGLVALWAAMLLVIRKWRWQLPRRPSLRRADTWLRTPSREDSLPQFFKSLVAWPTVSAAILFATLWSAIVVSAAIPSLLAIVPVFGYELGQRHTKDWVIGVNACMPLFPRDIREKGIPRSTKKALRVVNCVALSKDGKVFAEGVVVLATSSSVVLYAPLTGAVRRERTDGVSIEVIDNASWFNRKSTP
ncbi:hypothetical protein SAMN05518845_111152 [Variovorax sp. YR750]|uniref:hypothetical protein n=1 Tax=Variovorax sp. YR750 TaxID=1884384 RepID=UPI0008AF9676|nr:hypothetical protein [Variovorax sp. YR750]SEL79727.1 hypothetical protein SAMN05518845_111152 [Variovorax sp. YR750]